MDNKNPKLINDKDEFRDLTKAGYDHVNQLITNINKGDDRALVEFREFIKPITHELTKHYVRKIFGEDDPRIDIPEIADRVSDGIISSMKKKEYSAEAPINWHYFKINLHSGIREAIKKEQRRLNDPDKNISVPDHTQVIDENWGRDPAIILEQKQLWQDVARLSDREQEVIKLLFIEGLTVNAASSEMGVSQTRVEQLESRAIHKLREYSNQKLHKPDYLSINRNITQNRQKIITLFKPESIYLDQIDEHYTTPQELRFLDTFEINKDSILALMKADLKTDTSKRKLLINSSESLTYALSKAAEHYQFSEDEKKLLLKSIQEITSSAITLDELLEKEPKRRKPSR